jgi:hypothetical protein
MLPRENGCDALKGTSCPRRLAPSAGNPLANAVSERGANDQSDCNSSIGAAETMRKARRGRRRLTARPLASLYNLGGSFEGDAAATIPLHGLFVHISEGLGTRPARLGAARRRTDS